MLLSLLSGTPAVDGMVFVSAEAMASPVGQLTLSLLVFVVSLSSLMLVVWKKMRSCGEGACAKAYCSD